MTPKTALFKRLAACTAGLCGLASAAAITPSSAEARTRVQPYIEVQQVLNAEIGGRGDVLTYTAIAAGVDARTTTRRIEAQMSYRYEKRIAWEDNLVDDDVHTGIAQLRAQIIPNALTFNAGALATRARGEGNGPILGFTTLDNPNLVEVYSLYAGPDFSRRIGPVDVTASYRFGYVHIDDHAFRGLPLLPGATILDRFDSSTNHSLSGSIGMGPGALPFGWTVGAGYVREDVDRLDQDYEGIFVRGDVVFPVTPSFALTAGVGYETIESSQQDFLRGPDGLPLLTPGGNLIADPTRPRLTSYDQDGVIWDAGFIWRPSPRTEVAGRLGRRYGGTTVTGEFKHQINSNYGVTGAVYDSVSSYGRGLVADLRALPVNFDVNRNPFGGGVGGIGGCVFGTDPGTGTCFDDTFTSIAATNFRIRGANVLFSGGRGAWSYGAGAGYNQRKYLSPLLGLTAERARDESFTLTAQASRRLGITSSLGFDAYASWFDSNLPLSDEAFGAGASASYSRSFLFERLQAQAALGLFTTDSGRESATGVSALLGLRYNF